MARKKRPRVRVDAPPHPTAATLAPHVRGDIPARAFFYTALIALLIVVFRMFSDLISDILLAVLFASLISPVHTWLVTRLRVGWVAAGVSCVVVALVIVGPVVFTVVALSREAALLIEAARSSLSVDAINRYLFGEGWLALQLRHASERAGVSFTPDTVREAVMGAVGTVAAFLYERTNDLVSNFLVIVFHLIVTLLALFYLLVDGARFRAFVLETSPLPDDEDDLIISQFQSVGRAIIFGNGIGSIAQGIIGAVAMALVGFESPVLWGTVMAFAAFLPMVGISIVTIPATLYLVADGRYLAAILFFGITATLAIVFENVVKTRLIGSQVRMHDFVILLSILAGMSMFGLMGLLYGPLLVALLLVLLDLYQVRYRREVVGL